MKLLIVLLLLKICSINTVPSDGPQFPPTFRPWRTISPGHLQSFGNQRSPDGPVRPYIDRYLHPVDFWEYHVKHKLPLVYRNAINRSPAIKLWDDEYLLKNYGNLDVLVEKKVENRSYSPRRMVLKAFLNQYKKEDIYVVTVLPDAMRPEVQIVPSVLCGTFKTYLQETNLWIGSGGTSSIIHFDADHNIHCMVHGRKSPGSGSGYSKINVNKVDMNLYPLLKRVPWTYATLRAGDCIYIPGGYIHQVKSYKRSISVTTLFSPTKTFNSSGCENLTLKYTPMSEAPIHWTYKEGDHTIDLGYRNLVIVRKDILKLFGLVAKGKAKITKEMFMKYGARELCEDWQRPPLEVFEKYFDPDGNGYFTQEDIEQLPIASLKEIVRAIENPAGPLKAAERIDWNQVLADRQALEKMEEEELRRRQERGEDEDEEDEDDDRREESDDDSEGEDDNDGQRDLQNEYDRKQQHKHEEL
ncbi:Lysine-specific demethylase 8 [Trichoplax sp. H2]|nr:Lysine-specific demethylase 8 [Trichoplax sp. H2]|eukprot:RDD46653.1 Lysine-specific demethylase 8 [Trichoplax sp. H2]